MTLTGRANADEATGEKQFDIAENGAAVVFVRRKATHGIGHVGWGFLLRAGTKSANSFLGDGNLWEIGAVENHHGHLFTPPLKDGYWFERTSHPLAAVSAREYDHYKVFPIPNPNAEAALKAEALVGRRPYIAAIANCMNDVQSILLAYGASTLPSPNFIGNWIPNRWYRSIVAPEFAIDDPTGLQRSPA